MSIVPQVTQFFDGVALQLRRSAPAQLDVSADWHMGVDEACAYLDRIGELPRGPDAGRLSALPRPSSLQLFGGEPFRRPDDLERVLRAGRRNGMVAEVWTPGVWAMDRDAVRALFERLAGTLHAVLIWTSRALLDQPGLGRIELLMEEARLARLGLTIQCAAGPDAPVPRELLALTAFNSESCFLRVVPSPQLLADPAVCEENAGYLLPGPPRHKRCGESFHFVIAPGGDVYPCLRGVGVPALRLGSLAVEPAIAIVQAALARNDLRRLRMEGPYPLFVAARASPNRDRLYAGYADTCHFHCHVLSDPDLAEIAARMAHEPAGGDPSTAVAEAPL